MALRRTTARPHNFQDLTGQRFGYLTVITPGGSNRQKRAVWLCRCDCGSECLAAADDLKRNHKRSCGCQKWRLLSEVLATRAAERARAINAERISPDGRVLLPSGDVCLVDPADIPLVSRHVWVQTRTHSTSYARCGKTRVLMHILLMGRRPGLVIDHVNGDGLDNRRCNLRWATRSQNAANVKTPPRGRSRFHGVSGGWVAHIQRGGRPRIIGVFRTEEEAARAYDRVAREVFGEFAKLNFPDEV